MKFQVTRRAFAAVTALAVSGVAFGATVSAEDISGVTRAQIRATADHACEGGKQYTIAYSHSVSEAQAVRVVRRVASERAAELGCVKLLHDNTQANNLEQQLNAVQGWITLGVDAIVVTPIDPAALAPLQKQAQDSGIKWLTYLGEMEGSDGFVGFDHAQSGELIANAAVAWVKANDIENPQALVTTLTGLPSISPRWEEVERIFGENGIEIVSTQDSADQTSGLKIAETVLIQHPRTNIFIGLNDDSAIGMYRAIKVAGLDEAKVFVGGQDGSQEGLTAILAGGAYRGSSAILLEEIGPNIVDQALNAINGEGPTSAYTKTGLASIADRKHVEMLLSAF